MAQDRLLRNTYDLTAKRLIIFLTPGDDQVDGGIMSISSVNEENKKLKHIHGAERVARARTEITRELLERARMIYA